MSVTFNQFFNIQPILLALRIDFSNMYQEIIRVVTDELIFAYVPR